MFTAFRTRLALAAGFSVLILAPACGSSSVTSPSANVPFSQTDLVVGTGAEATAASTITGRAGDESRRQSTARDSALPRV